MLENLEFEVQISLPDGTTICVTPGGGCDMAVLGIVGGGPINDFQLVFGSGCDRVSIGIFLGDFPERVTEGEACEATCAFFLEELLGRIATTSVSGAG